MSRAGNLKDRFSDFGWPAILVIAAGLIFGLIMAAFAALVVALPIMSGVAGEMLDDDRHLTVVTSSPAQGNRPTWDQLWDMPSKFRLWPDDYLNPPAYYDGVVYVANEYDEDLYAIDVATGTELWRADIDMYLSGSVQVDETFVYAFHHGAVTVYDRHTGKRKWSQQGKWGRDAALSGGLIILPTYRWEASIGQTVDQITALRATTGEVVWTTDTPQRSNILVHDGVVYVGSRSTLMTLDASTGHVLTESQISGVARMDELEIGNDIVVVSDGSSQVLAYKPSTQTVLWRYAVPGVQAAVDPELAPRRIFALTVADSTVFVSQTSSPNEAIVLNMATTETVALALSSGETFWQRGDLDPLVDEPTVVDGVAYGFSEDLRFLVAFDPRRKDELWRIEIENPYTSGTSFTIDGNRLFLTVADDLFLITLPY